MNFENAFSLIKEGKVIKYNDTILCYFSPVAFGLDLLTVEGVGKHPLKPFILQRTKDGCFTPWTPGPLDLISTRYEEVTGLAVTALPYEDDFDKGHYKNLQSDLDEMSSKIKELSLDNEILLTDNKKLHNEMSAILEEINAKEIVLKEQMEDVIAERERLANLDKELSEKLESLQKPTSPNETSDSEKGSDLPEGNVKEQESAPGTEDSSQET